MDKHIIVDNIWCNCVFIYLFILLLNFVMIFRDALRTKTNMVCLGSEYASDIQSIQTLANTVWGLNMTRLLAMSAALRQNQLFNFCDVKIFYLFYFYKNYFKRSNKEWKQATFSSTCVICYSLLPPYEAWDLLFITSFLEVILSSL